MPAQEQITHAPDQPVDIDPVVLSEIGSDALGRRMIRLAWMAASIHLKQEGHEDDTDVVGAEYDRNPIPFPTNADEAEAGVDYSGAAS